jgi:hypothetical protein
VNTQNTTNLCHLQCPKLNCVAIIISNNGNNRRTTITTTYRIIPAWRTSRTPSRASSRSSSTPGCPGERRHIQYLLTTGVNVCRSASSYLLSVGQGQGDDDGTLVYGTDGVQYSLSSSGASATVTGNVQQQQHVM